MMFGESSAILAILDCDHLRTEFGRDSGISVAHPSADPCPMIEENSRGKVQNVRGDSSAVWTRLRDFVHVSSRRIGVPTPAPAPNSVSWFQLRVA